MGSAIEGEIPTVKLTMKTPFCFSEREAAERTLILILN
jgi:hypothetical protein